MQCVLKSVNMGQRYCDTAMPILTARFFARQNLKGAFETSRKELLQSLTDYSQKCSRGEGYSSFTFFVRGGAGGGGRREPYLRWPQSTISVLRTPFSVLLTPFSVLLTLFSVLLTPFLCSPHHLFSSPHPFFCSLHPSTNCHSNVLGDTERRVF